MTFQKSLCRTITVVTTAIGLVLMNVGMGYATAERVITPPSGMGAPNPVVLRWLKWVTFMAFVIGISVGLIQRAMGKVDGADGAGKDGSK